MEKKKNIVKSRLSENKTIEFDLDELEKDPTPAPKLEEAKLLISKLQSQKYIPKENSLKPTTW